MSLKTPFLLHLGKKEIEELTRQGAAAAPQLIMKGQASGEYCEMLGELWPLLQKHDQVDEENIDYMATHDKHGDSRFIDQLSKFDPVTAHDYKIMFEAAIRKEHKRALKLGIIQGKQEGQEKLKKEIAKQMLAEGESVEKIKKYTGLSIKEL